MCSAGRRDSGLWADARVGELRVVNQVNEVVKTETKKAREKGRDREVRDGGYILGTYVILRWFLLRYVY